MQIHHPFLRCAGRLSLLSLICLGLRAAHAGSSTWNLDPTSGDWNTAANWTPATVPNSPTDVATFDASNTTDVFISLATTVDSTIFNPGASAFSVTAIPGQILTFSGGGVANNSAITQNFATQVDIHATSEIDFLNEASAGDSTVFTIDGGHTNSGFGEHSHIRFFDHSSAGNSTIVVEGADPGSSDFDGGQLGFHDQSSAASAVVINKTGGATTQFYDSASAGRASFTLEGPTEDERTVGGSIFFFNHSNADRGNFTLEGSGANSSFLPAAIYFYGGSSAGHAMVTINGSAGDNGIGGFVRFFRQSNAADATLIVNGTDFQDATGGLIEFELRATAGNATIIVNGGSVAGGGCTFIGDDIASARMEVFGNGLITVNNSVQVGSIEGDGLITIGSGNSFHKNLIVGANNLNTLFSGVIRGFGRLQKVGDGTLTLTGANSYQAGTTIERGVLTVSNQTGSGTGTDAVGVSTGTLAGSGIIAGAVTVGSGSGRQAFLAPSFGTNKQVTLTLQSSLTLLSDGTYTYSFTAKENQLRTDLVIAGGVTINGAAIVISGSIQDELAIGTILLVISNTSANPISGTFSNLADGAIVNVNGNNLQASYNGGDGNDLTLTVVP